MKILILSDVHSSFENLKEILSSASYDLIFLAGDLTNFIKEDVFKIDEIISKFGEAYAVHGNCDYEEILGYDLDSINFVHAKSLNFEDFTLHGVGGSNLTLFSTPSEYSEEQMEEFFKKFVFSERNFLLSHCPPKGILDLTKNGIHVGCNVVKKYVENFEVIFCGHVHEAFGIEKNRFLAINPGPVFKRRYATFDTEVFEAKLEKL
ncbi:MAG: metallophosphoesterase family protein [Archaeoglobaceae archaeon]|nr:metallophosphoesterase family protein [Archaeoglobaceae archaeon]MCX8152341.1 metallophosphoesterase family protein [Archaeoglobaceae archaeon]MDW8013631.1 metallophosphoesterase family protein [Archaeoglobaceae archaeon]